MKKRLTGIVLCVYFIIAALFGGINSNAFYVEAPVSPQCDLPPVLIEQ
jgi:hypothetical protein